jgi:hypothetical protein
MRIRLHAGGMIPVFPKSTRAIFARLRVGKMNPAGQQYGRPPIPSLLFFTNDRKYRAFLKALERPAELKPKLQKLMRSNAPWGK